MCHVLSGHKSCVNLSSGGGGRVLSLHLTPLPHSPHPPPRAELGCAQPWARPSGVDLTPALLAPRFGHLPGLRGWGGEHGARFGTQGRARPGGGGPGLGGGATSNREATLRWKEVGGKEGTRQACGWSFPQLMNGRPACWPLNCPVGEASGRKR